MLFSWLHLIALAVYLGAVVGFWLMLHAALRCNLPPDGIEDIVGDRIDHARPQLLDRDDRRHLAQQSRPAMKLVFAFVLVILSVYQALGVGHRFVKRHEGGERVSPEELGSVIRRLKGANWGILLFAAITLWLGIRLRS